MKDWFLALDLADRALANPDLGRAVAHHKNWFFPAKAASGVPIEYRQAVDGGLRLVGGPGCPGR
jgi:hypothetical protein